MQKFLATVLYKLGKQNCQRYLNVNDSNLDWPNREIVSVCITISLKMFNNGNVLTYK